MWLSQRTQLLQNHNCFRDIYNATRRRSSDVMTRRLSGYRAQGIIIKFPLPAGSLGKTTILPRCRTRHHQAKLKNLTAS